MRYASSLIVIGLVWLLTFYPPLQSQSPYEPIQSSSFCHADWRINLPKLPTEPLKIWRLVEITKEVQPKPIISRGFFSETISLAPPSNQIELLAEATKLTDWPEPLAMEDLNRLQSLYEDNQGHTGLLTRLWGLVNFINLLWVVSIFGILLTLHPCLKVVAQPLIDLGFVGFQRLCQLLYPYRYQIGYILALWPIWGGTHCQSDNGFYFSLFGYVALAGLCIHQFGSGPFMDHWELRRYDRIYVFAYMTAIGFPLAIKHQSLFLGYLGVTSAYWALGFSAMCFGGLCFVIGFDNEDSMYRLLILNLLLEPWVLLLEIFPPSAEYQWLFYPFSHALMVYGHIVYFLTLLIMSSIDTRDRCGPYWFIQAIMVLSLGITTAMGLTLALPALINISLTFMILYVMIKVTERTYSEDWFIVVVFFGFILLGIASMYLSTHPDFLQSLINPITRVQTA